ncbi:MAG: YolD-like family protein [Firmicutes bacterium]|nr:YolD-like family protein [Bacillota bacterium]
MPVSERAKQFMPFSPLKGLYEALAQKEKVRVPRKILSEEKAIEINERLTQLQRGQIVTVIYYEPVEQEYLQLTGMVAKVDANAGILQIVAEKIRFEELYEIVM